MHQRYDIKLAATNLAFFPNQTLNYGSTATPQFLDPSGFPITPSWDINEVTEIFFREDASDYILGQEHEEVVFPGVTFEWTFAIKHDWNWIRP